MSQGEDGREIPRTTTTGDEAKDLRRNGDGAIDQASDSLHHTEDAHLVANTQGTVAAWRMRWRRRRER